MIKEKQQSVMAPGIGGMHLTLLGSGAVLLEPGEGLDPTDSSTYLIPLLQLLESRKATRLLYDLKYVPVIDEVYYHWLIKVHNACQVKGVELVVVNMQPQTAFALALTLEQKPPFRCALDVDRVSGN